MRAEKLNPVVRFKEWRQRRLDRPNFTPNLLQEYVERGIEMGTGGMGEIEELLNYTDSLQHQGQRAAVRRGFARAVSMVMLNFSPEDYLTVATLSSARKEAIDELTSQTQDYILNIEHARARMAILDHSKSSKKLIR